MGPPTRGFSSASNASALSFSQTSPAPDIKRKRLGVFCLLGRVVDSFFRPFIKMEIFDARGLGLADITCESIELAFHDSIMPVQYIRQRRNRRISWIVPRHLREFVAQRQPQLEFQIIAHKC